MLNFSIFSISTVLESYSVRGNVTVVKCSSSRKLRIILEKFQKCCKCTYIPKNLQRRNGQCSTWMLFKWGHKFIMFIWSKLCMLFRVTASILILLDFLSAAEVFPINFRDPTWNEMLRFSTAFRCTVPNFSSIGPWEGSMSADHICGLCHQTSWKQLKLISSI